MLTSFMHAMPQLRQEQSFKMTGLGLSSKGAYSAHALWLYDSLPSYITPDRSQKQHAQVIHRKEPRATPQPKLPWHQN
jgi:hypothetical protein